MTFKVMLILLCCCCFAHVVHSGLIERVRRSTDLRENEVQVIGVDVKSQLEILEELDLYSLTVTTKSNKKLSPLADVIFKRKFASKAIGIFGPLAVDPRYSVHMLDNLITNYSIEVFSLILSTFGHLIRKVVIGYNGITLEQRKDIHNLINEYCSTSLTAIELIEWDENVLESFTTALPKVEQLTLSGNLKTKSSGIFSIFDDKSMELNEIFPGVRQLTLDSLYVTDSSILNIQFPRLEHVKVELLAPPFNRPFFDYFTKTKPAIRKLFEKNPQIRYLSVNNCNSLDYLRIISDNLPSLEGLEVNFRRLEEKYAGEPIHFESLKKLNMKIGNVDMSQFISFKNIDKIRLECIESECNSFPFRSVSSLKRLFIVGYSFDKEKILELGEKAPFLENLFVTSESDIDASAMIRFVVGSKRLEKLTLVNPIVGSLFDSIVQHLNGQWTVSRNNLVLTINKQSEL